MAYGSAVALRVRPSGESNREAWFLTGEDGILRATVFGGPKSRLRAQVSPFHSGKLLIYHDPVRDSRKVEDFDVSSYRPGLRERYERAITAGAIAETILSTHGSGGDWPEAVKLTAGALDAIESAGGGAHCTRVGVYFLWRWALLLGVQPDLGSCASCAREASRDKPLWYFTDRESLFCEACCGINASEAASGIRIGPGARLWLGEIAQIPPSALARISLDASSLEQAKALSTAVLAATLGRRLATWDGI